MLNFFVKRTLKLGSIMSDLFLSTAGCFAFTRGFRLVAIGREGLDAVGSIPISGASRKPLAGIGAALFLLAFVASEALATIGALRY